MKAADRPDGPAVLLSQLEQRLRLLEHAQTLVVGPWRLTVDDAGALVASHSVTGAVRVLALPKDA